MRMIDADALSRVVKLAWDTSDSADFEKSVFIAIATAPTIEPEPRWIPVSERLPEPRVDVWVNSDIGQIQGYYEEHIGIWYASFGQGRDYLELIVTAWMPLPEPYREGEQDENR